MMLDVSSRAFEMSLSSTRVGAEGEERGKTCDGG
jgi:hypothetical protein